MKKDVLIGFPCYDNKSDVDILREIFDSIADAKSPIGGVQFYNGDSLVTRSRNKIAKMFLEQRQFNYLMFIDSDIMFSRDQVAKLRNHDKGICCGVYLKKKLPYEPVLNTRIGSEDGLGVYREAGTGFMMVRRDVFAAIRAMEPEHVYRADGGEQEGSYYDYFRVGVLNGRYLSEDYYFCHLAARYGYKTYVDESVLVEHRGRAVYPMADRQLFEGLAVLLDMWSDSVEFPVELGERVKKALEYHLSQKTHKL